MHNEILRIQLKKTETINQKWNKWKSQKTYDYKFLKKEIKKNKK